MLKRSKTTVLSGVLFSVSAALAVTPAATPAVNSAQRNAANQAQTNNTQQTVNPAATPNATNVQNPANTVNPANKLANQNGAVTDPNQVNNATALSGSGVLNSAGGAPAMTDDLLARLQNDTVNRKQVTLTGRIMDVQSFFLGGILGTNAPSIVGQPISAAQNINNNNTGNAGTIATPVNTNAATGTVVGTNNAAANNGVNRTPVAARQNGATNLAAQNQTQAGSIPPPGNVPTIAQSGNSTTAGNAASVNPNAMGQVSSSGQIMVLQTSSGALLVAQDPLSATAIPLSATATPVTIQGRIYERAGMRLMLVSAVNIPGATPIGTNTNNTINNNAINNNNLRNQAAPGSNRQTR